MPCDNNDHVTHTMGTMVGDDGNGNSIGVAPGAKWIAAKGCESGSCSESSLLASGQWVLAPTDLNGQNPRPDLVPDIVNNSWGGGAGVDTWYKEIVEAWVAAGIFPAFANGNLGPGCSTTSSPGGYVSSYSAGAFDSSNAIASFSSRGAGENGDIKPNIAAPGVDVRSSIPGGYDVFSGTSMATPHLAATVALMWSASPALENDVNATRELLDQTAIDVDATGCGGTAADTFTFGEGRLDAYAAVQAAPVGPLGALAGTISSNGSPLAGATVQVTGSLNRTIITATDGSYALPRLEAGPVSRCAGGLTVAVTVTGNLTKDIQLPRRADSFGYTCTSGTQAYVAGTTKLTLTGDDVAQSVTLPFALPFYGTTYSSGSVTTNGFVSFTSSGTTYSNSSLPSTAAPNAALYPFWDDLMVDSQSGVYTATTGTAPNRTFVIEWRNVRFYSDANERISFVALLGENGSIGYRYRGVDSDRTAGSSTTVGIENAAGTDALEYSENSTALSDGQSLTFTAPSW